MFGLLQSELFRLRKRTQSWLLIVIAFVLVALFYGGFAIGSRFASGTDAEDLKSSLPLTELSNFGLSIGLGFFGGVMLVIIAAGMMGNEYSWNTLRPMVARARSRASLITAKLLAMLIYAIVFSFVLAALTAGLSVVSSAIAGVDSGFGGAVLVDAFWYTVRAIGTGLPYLALAFLLATWARSNAAGIAGALGVSFIEPTIFGLLGALSNRFGTIQKGGIAWNVQEVLMNWSNSSGTWVSIGVIALYTAIFTGLTYVIFLRRDVTSG